MIQENKTFSMGDLAKTVSALVFAVGYYSELYSFYSAAYCKAEPLQLNAERLPKSPIAELYYVLMQDAKRNMVVASRRLEVLQGIADSTMLPDLDY